MCSKVFKQMFEDFAKQEEEEPPVITLSDDCAVVVPFLQWLHHSPDFSISASTTVPLLLFADKYDISDLSQHPVSPKLDLFCVGDRFEFEKIKDVTRVGALKEELWEKSPSETARIMETLSQESVTAIADFAQKAVKIGGLWVKVLESAKMRESNGDFAQYLRDIAQLADDYFHVPYRYVTCAICLRASLRNTQSFQAHVEKCLKKRASSLRCEVPQF
ncbi:hypothetical protein M427DRAFT_43109 [Gonapodya prolifera JEL478]|uniref:BTB domain-containing protein n=1 Tax=Gonapodya prolifera (strain JEL478) TaxID=1344416 RepID=A0A139AK72_GONPJ|nr:hypothetical protein M427DRAFT_43109 [Gonapodya prolifera JEL478]|eukprot:KXS17108.1 hypothetical protein M427DRAFT_43109 [Gonapodya prolifera JEL478]